MNRQHNDQKKNTKGPTMTYTIHETKDRTAQTSLNTEGYFTCSGRASSS